MRVAHDAGPGRGRVPGGWRHGMALRLLPVLAGGALLAALIPAVAGANTGPAYVALGDSYTAGPLIPDQTGSPVGCLRSTHSYPWLVAAAIGAASFRDASCQGATTADMTGSQTVPFGTNAPQLDALSAGTAVVTLGIGGNDIGFSSIVIHCTTLSLTDPFGAPCEQHYTSGGTDQLRQAIDKTAPKVAAVLAAIHQRAPHARVFLVGYPDILPNSGDGCWPLVPIAFGDVPYLRGIEQYMNQMLATEAAANGAMYVNTYTGSIGHDFCQLPGTTWVEGLVPTSPAEPMHPNALGEKALAAQVVAAIRG